MTGRRLVIGLGNPDRGDDAVGLHVVRRLAARALPSVEVAEAGGDALALLDRWDGAAAVVLVDAAAPLAEPGRIHRLDPTAQPLPREIALGSTHAFGLADTVELARTIGRLPARLTIYAIEAASFTAGAPLSPAVAAAVEAAAARIARELAADVTPAEGHADA
jgi:hydrogenase maturation protease